ncbi:MULTISPECIES: DUF3971 domain-containing protein [Bartonella]|uniref:YhdP family protein n=1 Tax=Bartonella TaxID=773 RepID=UPI0018DEB6D8|nr:MULTISPECIES: DUF3971 domain-containing protein [Bartonella]MBH9975395.1 hypothetical protein [Bartonella choladocola]MBI0015002.1 hypothetical protein [Bartonella sp. B10834G3]
MTGPHEEIRFKKSEIKSLDQFPSSRHGDGVKVDTPRQRKKLLKRCFHIILWAAFIVIVMLGLIFSLLKVGISGQYLTQKMQATLSQQLGDYAHVKINDARLSLDEDYHLALETQNVMLDDIKDGVKVDQIGVFRVGFSSWGLLLGKLQIAQIELHDANVLLPQSQGPGFLAQLPKDSYGRVDPDATANILFPAFDASADKLRSMSINVLVLKNISLRMPGTDGTILGIKNLDLRMRWKTATLLSALTWNGQEIDLEANANYIDRHARDITLDVKSLPLHLGAADDVSPFLPNGHTNNGHFRLKGKADLTVEAHRTSIDEEPVVRTQLAMSEGVMDFGTEQNIPSKFNLNLLHMPHSNKIEFEPSLLQIGGLVIPFNGAIGLTPANAETDRPVNDYRFEIVAQHAVSASNEVPDIALRFEMKLAGQFNSADKKAIMDEITINTPHGNLMGQGSLKFGTGSPETIFVLHVPQMDVAEAKQLWPVNISPGARRWVVSHIFGGQLKNGSIEIALPQGYFQSGIPAGTLSGNEVKIRTDIVNTRSDLVGDLPALRDASGNVAVDGMTTTITLDSGASYLSEGRKIEAVEGTMVIPWGPQRPVFADMDLTARGEINAAGEMIGYSPINARHRLPFNSDHAQGNVEAEIKLRFPVTRDNPRGEITYSAHVNFSDFSVPDPIENNSVSNASGTADVDKSGIVLEANGLLNEFPAQIKLVQPFENSGLQKSEKITLNIDDTIRAKHFAFLNNFLSGPVAVEIGQDNNGKRRFNADLTNADLEFSWAGWKKGKGMAAHAQFDMPSNIKDKPDYSIENFALSGQNLDVAGQIHIKDKQFFGAEFSKANLSRNDDLALKVISSGKSYHIEATGKSFDGRALIQQLGKTTKNNANDKTAISLHASIGNLAGFYGEELTNVNATYEITEQKAVQFSLSGSTHSRQSINVETQKSQGRQTVSARSNDAGALMRFMNYYDKIRGGVLKADLNSSSGQPLSGRVSIRNFEVVDEPRLATIVSSRPSGGGKSLNEAVRGKINSSSVGFDLAYAHIGKGDNYLVLDRGVLRGPTVGATFQGVLYDVSGNMSITGTFMPAYGLNRLFGDLPIIGQVLGNGRDRGLIGITFKIEGNAKHPQVMVNPISVIAPGIFRSIFEFQ